MHTDPVSTTGDLDHRHVSVRGDGHADVTADIDGTGRPDVVTAALHAEGGPLHDEVGVRLVDAVLDLPEVTGSDRLTVAMPAADGAMAGSIRDEFDDVQTRLAGATVVVDATHRRPDSASPAE